MAGGNVVIPACQDILKLIALRIAGMRISNRVRRIHDYPERRPGARELSLGGVIWNSNTRDPAPSHAGRSRSAKTVTLQCVQQMSLQQ